MKYFVVIILGVIVMSWSCNTSSNTADLAISDTEKEAFNSKTDEVVRIANDSLEYEILINEPGFQTWLLTTAQPRGFYSEPFLKTRNQILTINFNQRVNQPQRFNPNLYIQEINYQNGVDYGYEVNYLLYNYYVFFQRRFNQRLSGFVPRI